jgi:hypothetical protein
MCSVQHVPQVSCATLFQIFFRSNKDWGRFTEDTRRSACGSFVILQEFMGLFDQATAFFSVSVHAVVKYSYVSKERALEAISNFISPNSTALKMEAVLYFITSEILNTTW